MTDWRQQTVDTYNRSARELAEYFRGIGPRAKYIDMAFRAAGNPINAKVVEIGCGDGRDAKAILTRTADYLGLDISEELIKLAKDHAPAGRFEVADAARFDYPSGIDIVVAFASILHLNRQEVKGLFKKIHACLNPDGIVYISTKYRSRYQQAVKADRFGKRLFYFYSPQLLADLAGEQYKVVKTWNETIGKTEWVELILQKA